MTGGENDGGSNRKLKRKQKWKPLINPSDLVRLNHHHESSMGKTGPPLIQVPPPRFLPQHVEFWELQFKMRFGW